MLPGNRKRLKPLEEENAKRKKRVADLSLDKLVFCPQLKPKIRAIYRYGM
ncbi:MAG: hypothetical protein LLF75_06400 [Eubacteriales bacterium]|nr:hypothetical protein [Eubacteriales bacterium]